MSKQEDLEGSAYAERLTKKAGATRYYPINLHKFFPPDDEFATCVARLSVLREDLVLEVNGITLGPYEWLDKNGEIWRKNYFFRNSARTLEEIRSAIHTLNCLPEFKRATKRIWSITDQKNFKSFCKDLEKASELVNEVRNHISGHVKQKVVANALKVLGSDSTGFWEYPHDPNDRPTHTHHPFLNVLLIAMLQAGDSKNRSLNEVMKIPETMASLIHAIAFIDNIFELYVVERGLP